MFLLCFICILLCFVFHFAFIYGEIFRVRSGIIQFYCSTWGFYCSTWGKISCALLHSSVEKDSCCPCPFHLLNRSFHLLVMFHSFISYSFLVRFFEWDQVEFNSIALPMGKFHIKCSFFCLKRIHVAHALFNFLINLSILQYFKTKLLCFQPTLPHEIIYTFMLIPCSLMLSGPITFQKHSHSQNHSLFSFSLTSLR